MDEIERIAKVWRETTRTITLTNAEWATLSATVKETIRRLEGEREEWLELVGQTRPDGSLVCNNAAGLAEFWQSVIDEWKTVQSKIDGEEG